MRLYPRHWRARYGAELEAVLEQTPATPAAVLDVLRGAALAACGSLAASAPATSPGSC